MGFERPHCLEIKFKIAKQVYGPNVGVDDEVYPVNFLFHSLFRQVDLQRKIISTAYTSYPYKSYVEKQLNYDKNVEETGFNHQFYNQALSTKIAEYPIRRTKMKPFTIPRGDMDGVKENIFTGQIPADSSSES